MKILEINTVDFSPYVLQKTWKIQNNVEYAAWVDGNRITHRTQTRQKVTGTFSLAFISPADYDAFRAAVAAVTVDGYTPMKVYVDNEHQLMDLNVFLTTATKTVWTQMTVTPTAAQTPYLFQVSCKIEQR